MKPSLEEERRALLAQIEASRAVYRRMLSGQPPEQEQNQMQSVDNASDLVSAAAFSRHSPGFPRGRTVQWVMDHPMMVAAGVAMLVWAAPRIMSGRSTASAKRKHRPGQQQAREKMQADERDQSPSPQEGTARALLTAAALLLRNPATMRSVVRFAGNAWQWLQKNRQRRTQVTASSGRARQT